MRPGALSLGLRDLLMNGCRVADCYLYCEFFWQGKMGFRDIYLRHLQPGLLGDAGEICPVAEQVCDAHVPHDGPEVVGSGEGPLRDTQVHLAARGRGGLRGKQMGLDFPSQPTSVSPVIPPAPASQPDTLFGGKREGTEQESFVSPAITHTASSLGL